MSDEDKRAALAKFARYERALGLAPERAARALPALPVAPAIAATGRLARQAVDELSDCYAHTARRATRALADGGGAGELDPLRAEFVAGVRRVVAATEAALGAQLAPPPKQ